MCTNRLSIRRQGSGDPIILLHGWGMNAAVFDGIVQELAGTREVITVDLPGYGASRWDGTLSFSEQAELISREVPDGDLLGWSMGGLYALEMVRQRPDQFRRLYLACFNPCFVQRDDWSCAVTPEIFDEFAQNLKNGWGSTVSRFLNLQMHGIENARTLSRRTVESLQAWGAPNPCALDFGLALLKQQDMRGLLSQTNFPIKMILGRRDTLVPGKLALKIPELNSRIEVESIATAAHAPFLSHRQLFLSVL